MDALVIVCSWNTNGIMLWAWMLWSSYALRAAPHGGNGFPLRTDPAAAPAAKESCWNHRTQGSGSCVPPKTTPKFSAKASAKLLSRVTRFHYSQERSVLDFRVQGLGPVRGFSSIGCDPKAADTWAIPVVFGMSS